MNEWMNLTYIYRLVCSGKTQVRTLCCSRSRHSISVWIQRLWNHHQKMCLSNEIQFVCEHILLTLMLNRCLKFNPHLAFNSALVTLDESPRVLGFAACPAASLTPAAWFLWPDWLCFCLQGLKGPRGDRVRTIPFNNCWTLNLFRGHTPLSLWPQILIQIHRWWNSSSLSFLYLMVHHILTGSPWPRWKRWQTRSPWSRWPPWRSWSRRSEFNVSTFRNAPSAILVCVSKVSKWSKSDKNHSSLSFRNNANHFNFYLSMRKPN